MKDYTGYLICTDLDGTFVDKNGKLVEKNLEAIDEYMKCGGLFTVSTGRSAEYLAKTYGESIKINTHLICLNGTMIFDTQNKSILYKKCIDKTKLMGLEQYIKYTVRTHFHTANKPYESLLEIPKEEGLHKIVFVSETVLDCLKLRERLEARYGSFCDFNRSWDTGLEMLPKGSGKGDSIKKLREILGNRAKTIIAVGDYENDLTMLKEADIGVAVSNAADFVKAAADKITVSCEEGAIAKIIEEL